MTKRPERDFVDNLSDFFAHRKGLPVFVGVGLVFISLLLSLFPGLAEVEGFWGWLANSHILLHLGVIVGLLGVLLGDAL